MARADGEGASAGPAQEVVDEIVAAGGEAVANTDDISDWDGAEKLVAQAIDTFGRLDVLVNNAGILRDRMLANMSEAEWDAVIKVHLKGTAGPSHFAAAHWRDRSKAGETANGRLINTTSPSGIYGNVGQTNYGAAKAGIASFTIIAADELGRYGVTVNAIAPGAITRLTAGLGLGAAVRTETQEAHVAPMDRADRHLAGQRGVSARSPAGSSTSSGDTLAVAEGWHRGPTVTGSQDPSDLGPLVEELMAEARPNADMFGADRT